MPRLNLQIDKLLTEADIEPFFAQHFPNVTSIAENNETATVYESLGRIEQTYPAPISNCSQL